MSKELSDWVGLLLRADHAMRQLQHMQPVSIGNLTDWWLDNFLTPKDGELISFLLTDEDYRHEIRAFDVKNNLLIENNYWSIETGLQSMLGQYVKA